MAATPEIDFEHFLGVGPVRSEVLVLGAVDAEGRVALLRPDPGAAPGERIG